VGVVVPGQHGNAFDAAADGSVNTLVRDLVSGDGDGLEAGGAEAIDGCAGYAGREAGEHGAGAADVVALRAIGLAASEDYVFDFGRVESGSFFEDVPYAMSSEIFGAG
jgi:hypothetical protein